MLIDVEVKDIFGDEIEQFIVGVCCMDVICLLYNCKQFFSKLFVLDEQYIDSICCMLFVMVEDVCVVVIKMVECICVLQQVKKVDEEIWVMVVCECVIIYVLLVNWLGIGQLKWELEDLVFCYLYLVIYK